MPRLIYTDRHGQRRVIELTRQPVLVGRKESCDLCIDDGEISREHIAVRINEADEIIVSDRGSKNGTSVDGGPTFHGAQRVARQSIRIGEHRIQIESTGQTPALPPLPGDPPSTSTGEVTMFPSTRGIDLSKERLNLLMELTERMSTGTFDRRQLLERALKACIDTFDFERGLIALRTARGDTESPVTHNMQPEQVSRTILNPALNEGKRSVMNDLSDFQGNYGESVVLNNICSALCVPILHHAEVLGVIYGDRVSTPTVRPYQTSDVDFLAAVAQQIGAGLANLRLLDERLRYERAQAEIQQASAIQRKLLPARPLCVHRTRIMGFNQPSAFVSGDYYDYFELSQDQAAFIIADVSGHGLAAAMLAVNLQAAFHLAFEELALIGDFEQDATTLAPVARRINRLICRNTADDKFITATLGIVSTTNRQIALVNAGHHPPLVVGDEVHSLNADSDLLFGIEEEMDYQVQSFTLANTEQQLLFYTDGLIEAANPAGDLLGREAVVANLSLRRPQTDEHLLQSVVEHVRQHLAGRENEDDMTLLTINFDAPPTISK